MPHQYDNMAVAQWGGDPRRLDGPAGKGGGNQVLRAGGFAVIVSRALDRIILRGNIIKRNAHHRRGRKSRDDIEV